MGLLSSAFETVFGVGSVDQPDVDDVLNRLPLATEYTPAEIDTLYDLGPTALAARFRSDGLPKWAAAVESADASEVAREERHRANVRQTAADIQRDAGKVGRRGTNLLPVGLLLAAVLLLGSRR